MDKAEAILAVELNAICESGTIKYYAYGNERIKELGKPPREFIIIHDLKANSITRKNKNLLHSLWKRNVF